MITLKLKPWHIALIALAVAGLLAYALGWRAGSIVGLLGLAGSAEKARRGDDAHAPQQTHEAHDLAEEVDEQADEDQDPSLDDLADDINEITQ